MQDKILIINLCKEKLHFFEFVKPIADILVNEGRDYDIKEYDKLKPKTIKKYNKIIICGTSLQDNQYLENIVQFEWIKSFEGKILGICAGMQIICKIFGANLIKKEDIGLRQISLKKDFLGMKGWVEVYELHDYAIQESPLLEKDFEVFSLGSIDAIKHINKDIYGVLFHPEARQKEVIKNFIKL